MMADCPACGEECSVEYVDPPARYGDPDPTVCECAECGARFEVEADGDFDGDKWCDTSQPGRMIGAAFEDGGQR